MDGLSEPSRLSQPHRESNWVPIGLGIVFVIILVGIIAWVERSQPKTASPPPPYAANLKFSDLKMNAAQNFVGNTVTYLDGTITNTGNQTVTHVVVHVVFQDSVGQVAQLGDVPLQVMQSSGPHQEGVDLSVSPLPPRQSKSFRLTFEQVNSDWNHAYPALQITGIVAK